MVQELLEQHKRGTTLFLLTMKATKDQDLAANMICSKEKKGFEQ